MNYNELREQASQVNSRLDKLGLPGHVHDSGVLLRVREAEILAELADFAVRRGYKPEAAQREIRSRTPHKFGRDPDTNGLTCRHCGRSEIFGIHRDQDGDQK